MELAVGPDSGQTAVLAGGRVRLVLKLHGQVPIAECRRLQPFLKRVRWSGPRRGRPAGLALPAAPLEAALAIGTSMRR